MFQGKSYLIINLESLVDSKEQKEKSRNSVEQQKGFFPLTVFRDTINNSYIPNTIASDLFYSKPNEISLHPRTERSQLRGAKIKQQDNNTTIQNQMIYASESKETNLFPHGRNHTNQSLLPTKEVSEGTTALLTSHHCSPQSIRVRVKRVHKRYNSLFSGEISMNHKYNMDRNSKAPD